jgi:hypothetical protein
MRRLFQWARRHTTPFGVLDALLVLAVIYVTVWSLHPNLLVSSTLLTGGDTGSHLALPAYLKTTGNAFNFTPWYPGWLDGLPAYTYYFVLPDVLATFASYVIGFAVAFKLATVLGSVLLPITAYALGRLFKAPRPIPAALALATLPFLFDATFTIDGGNLFSSMAGEYAFSLSLALALLTIGLFARGVRTGRGYWLAGVSLSATLAAHVLPWLFGLGAIAVVVTFELLHRRGIGEPRVRGTDHAVKRPHPLASGVAVLLLAFVPLFFDTTFWASQSIVFAQSTDLDSRLLSVALVLYALGLLARGRAVGGWRGYWLGALCALAAVASLFTTMRATLCFLVVVTVFALVQTNDDRGERGRLLALGDFARPVRFAVGAGLLSLGLSAWWLFPFATSQSLTDSLGYINIPVATLHDIFSTLGWFNATGGAAGDRWVIVLGGLAVVVAFAVRDRLGMILGTLTVLSFWAFVLDPQSAIWNQRLIPFWFISIHLVAGWLVGYVAWRWVSRVPRRGREESYFVEGDNIRRHDEAPRASTAEPPFDAGERAEPSAASAPLVGEPGDGDARRRVARVLRATVAVGVLGLASTVPGLVTPLAKDLHLSTSGNQVTSWAAWNYSGYQAKPAWPEYHDIMTTMTSVARQYGCGRAMWEYNSSENRFGTPEALMLLPYWTDNCVDSMEGLLMESSPTTPYHYLDQSELSLAPSDPQAGLDYEPLNVAEGVRHLQMLGVRYYLAFSPEVIAQADADPELRLVASTRNFPSPGVRWYIFLVRDSPMVQALRHTPNVVANISSQSAWLASNEIWWLSPKTEDVYAAESGPASWPRAANISVMTTSAALPAVRVTKVKVGLQSLSFHVSRVGVPMLVKISYYPRWHATGATGPYRVSPNLMAVVPTSKDVSLVYGSTPSVTLGDATSDVAVVAGLVVALLALRRRRNLRR